MNSKIFDIRTSTNALATLTNLSGVSKDIWDKYVGHEQEYEYVDDLVEDVIRTHGHMPNSFTDFDFIFFMLLQVQMAVNLFAKLVYLIPKSNTKEFCCWPVGRKFYYDFSICGFLSIWDISPYGGLVHARPEVLMNLDKLLNLSLSREWANTHTPYQVTAKAPGDMIIYYGDDGRNDTEKVIYYLTKAYDTAFGAPREEILLIKNDLQIPPQNIIDISTFVHWQRM